MEVKALNSTSILVKWSRVNEDSRNGIITRYTIHYEDVSKGKKGHVNILAPATETIINGLRQKTEYSFKILAATSKGDGPYSNTTKEETEGNTFQSNLATYSKMVNFNRFGEKKFTFLDFLSKIFSNGILIPYVRLHDISKYF